MNDKLNKVKEIISNSWFQSDFEIDKETMQLAGLSQEEIHQEAELEMTHEISQSIKNKFRFKKFSLDRRMKDKITGEVVAMTMVELFWLLYHYRELDLPEQLEITKVLEMRVSKPEDWGK